MQEPTELTKVQNQDEIGKTIEEGQIESLKREMAQYQTAMEKKKADKEDFDRQAKYVARIRELQIQNLRKVPEHIVWNYEKLPEYWELQDQLMADKHRQENHMDKARSDRYQFEIDELSKRIADIKDSLSKIEKN